MMNASVRGLRYAPSPAPFFISHFSFIMSIVNPLTDPRTREEELLQLAQQQLLKAIAEEQEKIKRKDAIRNVEAKGEDNDEPAVAQIR